MGTRLSAAQTQPGGRLDGISFASHPGCLYVSIREISEKLDKSVSIDPNDDSLSIDNVRLDNLEHLYDGTGLMQVGDVKGLGATVSWDQPSHTATVSYKSKSFEIKTSDKTVIIDKSTQSLMAYQGSHLVLLTHVSTGREGHGTPNGDFTAGPAKEKMHRSRLYHFAPMPYSVQVDGNVFIHGYTSVPNRPASHGCIRMPLTGRNPARYFFNWVDIGTPVTIKGVWSNRSFASRWSRHHHYRNGFRYAKRHYVPVKSRFGSHVRVASAMHHHHHVSRGNVNHPLVAHAYPSAESSVTVNQHFINR